ncbi:hypothetical protein DMENIID0001_143960 [Sergentomyia squamirostris]
MTSLIQQQASSLSQSIPRTLRLILLYIIIYAFGIGTFLGLLVFNHNPKNGKHSKSTFLQIWTVFVTVGIAIFYPYIIVRAYATNENILGIETFTGAVAFIQMVINYLFILLVYVIHFVKSGDLIKTLDDSEELAEELSEFITEDTMKFHWEFIVHFLRKSVVVNLVALAAGIMYIRETNKMFNTVYGWETVFILVCPYCIQTFSANIFFLGFLRGKLYLQIINHVVAKTVERINGSNGKGHFKRLHQFTKATNTLDVLSVGHFKICSIVRTINAIYGPQMLILVGSAFFNTMIQFFYLYISMKINFHGGHLAHWSVSFYSVLYACFQFVDLYFHAMTSLEVRQESRRTGHLLHKLPSRHVDEHFKKTVDLFSIQIIQTKLEITLCRMFPLDITLIASSVSTIIEFLIILIQFDLTLNHPANNMN